MDQQMDALWWKAQRRIDYAAAGACACALWAALLPLVVLLTPMRWNGLLLLATVSSLPIGLIFARPLDSGRRVVRAIAQRDADEVRRWRKSSLPPAHPELISRRVWGRRPRLPMLSVVAAMTGLVAVLAFFRRTAPDYPAMAQYSLGIAVAAMGLCLSAVVQMFRGKVGNRTILAGHILVTWLVPLGVGIASVAMITGRQDIATAVAVRAMTAMVYVIFGLVGMLVTVVMAALWFALVTVLFHAPNFDDHLGMRDVLHRGVGLRGSSDDEGDGGAGDLGADAGSAGAPEGAGDPGTPGAGAEADGLLSSGGAAEAASADASVGVRRAARGSKEAASTARADSGKSAAAEAAAGRRGSARQAPEPGAGSVEAERASAETSYSGTETPRAGNQASGTNGRAAEPSSRHSFMDLLRAGVDVEGIVAAQSPSEFDEEDVAAVREELAVERSDYVLAGVIVAATASVFALACAGLSGTPAHVVVGVVLAAAVSMHLHRIIAH